jgi:fibronectin type 3 domain-containing protein
MAHFTGRAVAFTAPILLLSPLAGPRLAGSHGAPSSEAPPAAPSNLVARAVSQTEIRLQWTDNANNETGFKIEAVPVYSGTLATTTPRIDTNRSISGTNLYRQIGTVGIGICIAPNPCFQRFSHTGLQAGQTYTYRVRAYNGDGNSAYSNTVTATTLPLPPAAPTSVLAIAEQGPRVRLGWQDNATNEAGYRIQRSNGLGGFVGIGVTDANVRSYVDNSPPPATQVQYRIIAYNASFNSQPGSSNIITTLPLPPAAPGNLSASGISASRIRLSWTRNSTNEAGFTIERAAGTTTSFATLASVAAGVTSYEDANLQPLSTFNYRVRAGNAGGSSAWSNTASATTTSGLPPTAPSGLTATAVSSTQINLSWSDASNETGYVIERATGTLGTFSLIGAPLPANTTTYQNTGLAANTSYTYRVRAQNPDGAATSSTATAQTLAAPPAAPTGLTATGVSTSQINLAWSHSGTDEQGFRIERAAAGTTSFTEIAQTGPNQTTFSDANRPAGTSFAYRVRAFNAAGNSAYSNTATGTTAANLPTQVTANATLDGLMMLDSENSNVQNTSFPTSPNDVGCNSSQSGAFSGHVCGAFAVKFSTLQQQIAGRSIASAVLRLTVRAVPQGLAPGVSYSLSPYAADWNANITFASSPNTTSPAVSVPAPTVAGVTVDINVTSIVQAWANGTIPNFGLNMTDTLIPTGNTFRGVSFHSTETGGAVSGPRLIVTFQ